MKKGPGPLDYAAWLVLASLIKGVRALPRRWGYLLGEGLFSLLFRLWKSRRKVAIQNIRTAFPDMDDGSLVRLARDVYLNLSRFCVEFCWMPELAQAGRGRFVRVEGIERLHEAYRRGKGVLLATAHYDNFEWMNAAVALSGLPTFSVIREVDNPYVDRLLDGMRNSVGVTVIKSGKSAGRIVKELRSGHVVTMAADMKASFNDIPALFLGQWSSTVKAPAVMHLRTGAPLFPAYSVREEDNSHTVHIMPEIRLEPSGDVRRDVYRITQAVADAQTEFIRKRPELWFWLHRRWSKRPLPEEIAGIGKMLENEGAESDGE